MAHRPMQTVQVDLVDFSSISSKQKSIKYSNVLAVIDIFSRFLFLRPLVKKESKEIATFARPHICCQFSKCSEIQQKVQIDQGSELEG